MMHFHEDPEPKNNKKLFIFIVVLFIFLVYLLTA